MTINVQYHFEAELAQLRHISTKDLSKVLSKHYPDMTENTLSWKIHDLTKKGVIRHLERGLYSLTDKKQEYQPEITGEARSLYMQIRQDLPYVDLCISDTGWFNEFMLHQVFKTYLILDVEKEAIATVIHRLFELEKDVFIDPRPDIFDTYVAHTEDAIIIKPLISESPMIEQDDIKIAPLEKMLVDCICDKKVYGAQYQEINLIFRNVLEKYNLNTAKLRRYARRRNKVTEINQLLQESQQS